MINLFKKLLTTCTPGGFSSGVISSWICVSGPARSIPELKQSKWWAVNSKVDGAGERRFKGADALGESRRVRWCVPWFILLPREPRELWVPAPCLELGLLPYTFLSPLILTTVLWRGYFQFYPLDEETETTTCEELYFIESKMPSLLRRMVP